MTVTPVGQPVAAIKSASGTTKSFTVFTPNAGSSYAVGVAVGSDGSGTAATITGVAWASGGSFTRKIQVQANAFQPEASIWYSTTTGTGAITVTGNAHVTSIFAWVEEITGDNKSSPTGNSASAANTGNLNTLTVAPASTGGRILYVAIDIFEGFTVTPNAASTAIDSWNNGGAESYGLFGNADTVAGVNYTIGVTNTVSDNNHVAIEIVPASGGPVALTGSAPAADAAKGTLGAARAIAARSAAAGSAKASAAVTRPLAARAGAASSGKASAAVARPLAARAGAADAARGDLTVTSSGVVALAGKAVAAGAARGALALARPLLARLAVAGGARGDLSVVGPGTPTAPAERTYTVPAEQRAYPVPADPRVTMIPADPRTLEVSP